MIFILIRIFPILLPILYLALVESVLYFNLSWLWSVVGIGVLDIIYFILIFIRKNKKESLFFILHSLVFLTVGFAYFLVLSSELFINLFIIAWSLIYFVYLESIFHYFYETKKVLIMSLKNVISYVNLITFFFLMVVLFNLHVFIGLSSLFIVLISFFILFILLISRFNASDIVLKKSLLYSFFLSIILTELIIASLFLSVSFFVSALILSVFYYIFSSLSALSLRGELTKTSIMQYIVFTVVVIIMVVTTSQWL